MTILLTVLGLLLSLNSFADCKYTIDSKNVEVKWTAFKTPKKLGVSGKFTDLGISGTKSNSSLNSVLIGTKFSIDPTSVSSGDKSRDMKIAKYFFGNIDGKKITGEVSKMSKGVVELNLKMNGVTQNVPLVYTVDGKANKFKAEGYIDLFDFTMNKSLKALNDACNELHEGKTWSDVAVALTFEFDKQCE